MYEFQNGACVMLPTRDNPMWVVSLSEITDDEVGSSYTPHIMSGCRDMIFPSGLVSLG
jgi:hypothetical protein